MRHRGILAFLVAITVPASSGAWDYGHSGSGPIADRPTCDVNRRGTTWHISAVSGTADTPSSTCEKLANDTYAWVTPATMATSGYVPPAHMASGTASSSTYLRGDGTWATPAGGSEAFPVGSVFISVVETNPATLLGYGTWSAIGAGRTLVGLDSGDTDFDTVEETGGAKTHTLTAAEMPVHTHVQDSHNHTQNAHTHVLTELRDATTGGSTTNIALAADTSSTTGTKNSGSTTPTNQAATATNQNAGSGSAHSVMDPYFVVYLWKRDS